MGEQKINLITQIVFFPLGVSIYVSTYALMIIL